MYINKRYSIKAKIWKHISSIIIIITFHSALKTMRHDSFMYKVNTNYVGDLFNIFLRQKTNLTSFNIQNVYDEVVHATVMTYIHWLCIANIIRARVIEC